MKPSIRYTGLLAIFVASLTAAAFFHYFPVGAVGELAGIPAIAALFGALFQLARDSIAYDRTLRLQEAKNRFTVGTASHMANIAFDKHVSFCEEYAAGIDGAMETLFRRGPHKDVLQNADTLVDLRRKCTVWLTPEIETTLVKFEAALRKIGANAWLLGELRADEDRTDAVKEAFSTFAAVFGWSTWKGEPVTRDVAAEKIVDSLRDVLGIKELTQLRTELIKRALGNLKANPAPDI